jgi:hypothetical protein
MEDLMKKLLCGAVALALATAAFAAPPTPVFVKTIDLTAGSSGATAGSAPIEVAYYGGNLFVNTFNDRKVWKIADPLGTEAVTQFADLTNEGSVAWPAGRGPQGMVADPENGDIYIAADDGTVGVLLRYNQAGAKLTRGVIAGTVGRMCAIALFDTDHVITGASQASRVFKVQKSDLQTVASTSGLPDTTNGWGAALRDFVVESTSEIYYANTTTNATGWKVGKFLAGPTVGDFTTYTFDSWYANPEAAAGIAYHGISKLVRGAESWILDVNVGGVSGAVPSIDFVNRVTKIRDLKFEDAANFAGLRGVEVFNIGGTDYMFVTDLGGTTVKSVVHVYSLGASAVSDWSLY